MSVLQLDNIPSNIGEVIEQMLPGEELRIVSAGQPIAKIIRATKTSWPSEPGGARAEGRILWMADDFDAPLDDFAEYMK